MVDMTADALQQITKEMKQYNTPSLNDKLYLHFKGWKCIEPCIGAYTGVKALWLEGNGLGEIQNLDALVELRCLYVQQNCLRSLEGLHNNQQLDAINACQNALTKIDHISHLSKLHTLQVANNHLGDASSVEHLTSCPSISVLDLQNNKLEDPVVLDILASMPDLRVLQMQGNPVTRKIKHYRKTVIARCQQLTYLDDRPVFEDERRTTSAWARAGAAHKAGPDGNVTAAMLAEAFIEESFNTEAAHEAEKDERKKIREEKEAAEQRNRDAFQGMITDARVRRITSVLPSVRLFEGLGDDVIYELAHRIVANPVHTNTVCGFAKDETAVASGAELEGLYFLFKGKIQFCRNGKACFDGISLQSGQYFGETALCTQDVTRAQADVVCREYSEIFLLSKDELLEVAEMYDGTLDILQSNRPNALRVQWYECKPWKAYDLANPSSQQRVVRENAVETRVVGPEGDVFVNGKISEPYVHPSERELPYPREYYGRNELARMLPESDDARDTSGLGIINDEYQQAWERVQQQKAEALAQAGLTESQFEENRRLLLQQDRERQEQLSRQPAADNDDDLPALEDVDVTQLTSGDWEAPAAAESSSCDGDSNNNTSGGPSNESATTLISEVSFKETTPPRPSQPLVPSPAVGGAKPVYTDMDSLD